MNVIEQIHQHRSIRKYEPDPVSENIMDEILNAGIRTSSSGNMQTYSIIITRDPDLRHQLLEPHLQQSMVIDAPVLLTFCADFHRMRRWLNISNAPDNFDNYFSFMVGAIDAILVSQTVALAAESLGLGICFLDLRDRLPSSGLIHKEKYQSVKDDDLRKIYQEREKKGWVRYMQSKRLKELAQEHGVENLAQLYTIVKYTKSSHQEYSSKLLDYLSLQDFMNNAGH